MSDFSFSIGLTRVLQWACGATLILLPFSLYALSDRYTPDFIFVIAATSLFSLLVTFVMLSAARAVMMSHNDQASEFARRSTVDAKLNHIAATAAKPQTPIQTPVPVTNDPPRWPLGDIEIYKGETIRGLASRVSALGHYYADVGEAKRAIDHEYSAKNSGQAESIPRNSK